jgi:hypothetical protein
MSVPRIIAVTSVTTIAGCLATPPSAEVDAASPCVRISAGGFDEAGTFDRTRELSTGYLGLAPGQSMGFFTTRVFAAPPSGRFQTIRWQTVRPSLKALPDARGRETSYAQGSADLANNHLLFHFDDPPAWDDTSGNNLATACNTAPMNQCPTVAAGLFRDAIDIDVDENTGSDQDNDRLRIASIPQLEPPQATLEVWVRPSRVPMAGARMMVVHKGSASPSVPPYASYSIEYNPDGTWRCYAHVDVAGEELVDGTRMSAPMQWHHVACTYDGVALRLFVNGYPDGEDMAIGTLAYDVTGSPDVILGDYNGSQFFDGQVDELAVHDRALQPAVIQERARRGALRLVWQVRTCDDAACDGEDDAWRGPTGTMGSWYSESCSTSPDQPNLPLSDLDCDGDGTEDDGAERAVPAAPFLQARAQLDTHRAPDTPELIEVELCE